MTKYKGMKLNKEQAEELQRMIDYMKELHELSDDENADMQDTTDGFLNQSEQFLISINAIDKTIF